MEKRAWIFESARMYNNNSSWTDRIQKMTEKEESRMTFASDLGDYIGNDVIHHDQE